MYRNTSDFCTPILCPTTLLNLFISPNCVCVGVDFLGFSIYKCDQKLEIVLYLLSNLLIFISFSCPNALSTISSTMLNRCDKSGCLCPIQNLRVKAFSLLPLSTLLTMDFSLIAFIRLRKFHF